VVFTTLLIRVAIIDADTGYENGFETGWPPGDPTVLLRTITPTLFPSIVSTVAGQPSQEDNPGDGGSWDGVGTLALFRHPVGIALHGTLDKPVMYIADSSDHRVRKITRNDQHQWETSLVAGNGISGFGDGSGARPGGNTGGVVHEGNAIFNNPMDVVVTQDGSVAYVADTGNNRIRKIVLQSGMTSTLAGSGVSPGTHDNAIGALATFNDPTSLVLSPDETYLLVSEQGNINHAIRNVSVATGKTVTWLGARTGTHGYADGSAQVARFHSPAGMAFSGDGKFVYVADSGNHVIRRVNVITNPGSVITWAGSQAAGWDFLDGIGTEARFGTPWDIAIHDITRCNGIIDSRMFVVERGNNRVRVIDMETVRVTTLAGTAVAGYRDGPAPSAQFFDPLGIAVVFGGAGLRVAYVADRLNHAIRQVPMEIEMSHCKDINQRAYMEFQDDKVPLGADLVVNWWSDYDMAHHTDRESGLTDWVGLYKQGDCTNATSTHHTTLQGLHQCYIAWRPFKVAGLQQTQFRFHPSEYKETGTFEVRYFTDHSSTDAHSGGMVCGGGLGSQGRIALEGYPSLCWLDAFAISSPVEVYVVQSNPGLYPDRHPFNDNQNSIPGLERDSLEG